MCLTVFPQPLLVLFGLFLGLDPVLHTPYSSSSSHLFTTYAHTIVNVLFANRYNRILKIVIPGTVVTGLFLFTSIVFHVCIL